MYRSTVYRSTFGLAAAVAGLLVAPGLASALSAVTAEPASLRAGPALDFPVVDQIPSDVRVDVHGCVRGYRWCDVSWRDARGWVSGQDLAYLYEGRRVTIVEYGPRIGLPVVGFAFDTYWDRYYRGRTWYGERARWRGVWRDRNRNERNAGDRIRNEEKVEQRGEAGKRQGDDNDRAERRGDRNERPNVRSGRGEWSDRGEARGYRPQFNTAPRQETDRGMRQGGPGGRADPGAGTRERGPGGQGGPERGSPGQGGDRRP